MASLTNTLRLLATAVAASIVAPAWAATAWYEAFDEPTSSFRVIGSDGQYRLVAQQRVEDVRHTGQRSEWLQVQGAGATYVYVQHEVGHPRVIEDLRPTLWARSDRPGIQLVLRIALPRSRDPRTGRPLTTLVAGTSYNNVGRWQQLQVDNIPKQLARQVRALRTQYGPTVDSGEAYVDGLLVNIYGGPGVTNVWFDDLDIAGFVDTSSTAPPRDVAAITPVATTPSTTVAPVETRRIRMTGSVLLVDGHPFFPRAVQYRGEPLALLRKLGFNTVWLDRLAADDFLEEARAAGMWIICPPPRAAGFDPPDEPATTVVPVGAQYAGVLCWDLGQGLAENDVEATRRWAQHLRMADRGGRPLVCQAQNNLLAFSRACDVLLLDRRPLSSSLELSNYAAWIAQQPRLARPGTPVWTTVQTQLPAVVRQQLALLDPGRTPPSSVSAEQLRLLVYHAVAAGSRGLFVQSDTPLSADDAETRDRAAAIELLNLEIDLLEPWAAAGALVAHVESSEPQVTGAVIRAERAQLLMPMWAAPGAQFVPAQSATNNLLLTVPGLPESASAYQLTPGNVQALRHKRVTGGTRVTIEEFGLTDLVLLAQDPLVINSLMQRSAAIGRRAAELHRQIAGRKLQTVQETAGQLASRAVLAPQTNEWLQAAGRDLARCDQWIATKNYAASYVEAARAMRALRLVERAAWEKSTAGLPAAVASPGAVAFASLPTHGRTTDRISASRLGPNLLPGGNFERLDALVQAGWHNWQRAPAGVTTRVDLSTKAGRGGGLGLILTAQADKPETAPAAIESPPIFISSAPVAVEAGQLVCVHGWVNIPAGVTASPDGLTIFDSLTGEALAARFNKTTGWQHLLLYRIAPQAGMMQVHISLGGLGEVYLDDLAVSVLQPSDRPAAR